ncbi:hypothetical protein KL938_005283 [Ogataea parapolymorpha]|nr:hypothetical protein KL938_005283 [Ogataea parapolymorpha]
MVNDNEISKEERLEQARKKFEELKKKKKGKKKGNVGDHERESKDKEKLNHSFKKTMANTATGLDTGDNSEPDDSETLVTPDDCISGAESIINEQEVQVIPERLKFDDNDYQHGNDRKSQEPSKLEITGSSDSPDLDAESEVKQQSSLVDETKSQYAEESHDEDPSKQVKYLEAKLRDTIEQNSQLLKENLELKSAQLLLTSKISSLEEKVQSFEILNNSLQRQLSEQIHDVSCAEVSNSGGTFHNSSLEKDSPTKSSPGFQTFNSFNNLSNDYLDIVDIRERLAQWKGWNLDMKSWRSVGSGSLLEL